MEKKCERMSIHPWSWPQQSSKPPNSPSSHDAHSPSSHDAQPLFPMMRIAPLHLILLQSRNWMLTTLRSRLRCDSKKFRIKNFHHRCTKYSVRTQSQWPSHGLENNGFSRFCSRLCFINTTHRRLDQLCPTTGTSAVTEFSFFAIK